MSLSILSAYMYTVARSFYVLMTFLSSRFSLVAYRIIWKALTLFFLDFVAEVRGGKVVNHATDFFQKVGNCSCSVHRRRRVDNT
jgi:hypothetical protein